MPYIERREGRRGLAKSCSCSRTFLMAALAYSFVPVAVANYGAGQLKLADLLPANARNYDKMRPPRKDGQPTRVFFHVTVMGIDSINENSMTYAADIFFAQTWTDDRLRLPENMTSEYRLLEVEWLNDMWRPDSYFKNAKQVTFQTMTIPNHYVWLYKSKMILYMVKLTLTLSCAMNYATYPHDTQECRLQIESLSHTTEDLIFEWEAAENVPLVVDENIQLPQFDLVRNTTAECTQVYSTGNFTCLEVVFTLKRRLGYYLFHTYMPTCLIVIMSWISFWIKPESAPARVTLGVTSLLTLSTQHAKSQASLPPVSYIKIIDMFMNTCTIFVFLALMEYALVNIVLGDGPDSSPAPMKKTVIGAAKSILRKTVQATQLSSLQRASHSNEGRLMCLAQKLRLSQSSSPARNIPRARESSPKLVHSNSSDTSSDNNAQLTQYSHSLQRVSPHSTTRMTYRCGHQYKDSKGHPLNVRTSGVSVHDIQRSVHGDKPQIGSHSYPHLPGCNAIYVQTSSTKSLHNRTFNHVNHQYHSQQDSKQRLDSAKEIEIDEHNLDNSVKKAETGHYGSSNIESPSPGDLYNNTEQIRSLQADLQKIVSDGNNGIGEDLPGSLPPPPPPPQSHQKLAATLGAQKRRAVAITVDRVSRVLFPLAFGMINLLYWVVFWIAL